MNNCFSNPSLNIIYFPIEQIYPLSCTGVGQFHLVFTRFWAPYSDNNDVPYLYVVLHIFQNTSFDPPKI